jgi:DNA-binding transcriptional regulator YiaG
MRIKQVRKALGLSCATLAERAKVDAGEVMLLEAGQYEMVSARAYLAVLASLGLAAFPAGAEDVIVESRDVGELLGIADSTLRNWRRDGKGPEAAYIDGRYIYLLGEVVAWRDAEAAKRGLAGLAEREA